MVYLSYVLLYLLCSLMNTRKIPFQYLSLLGDKLLSSYLVPSESIHLVVRDINVIYISAKKLK